MIHKTISFFLPLAAVLLVLAVLTVARIPSENNDEESDRLYLFEEAEDGGSYILAKVRDRSVTAAVIPGLYHGLPVTEIGEGAFSYCKMLTDVCFPNTVRKIGENAFQYCTGLKEADLPEGLAEIGDQAFFHCYALERVVIPDGVCRIGENAFYNCTALAEILIPDSVSEIGYGALQTGSMFQKVRLSGGMRAQRCLYLHVFYDVDKPPQLEERSVFGSYWPSCADLVIVPEGVESIEASFLENSMINRIMLPSSLKRIDARCYSEGLYKPIEKVFYKGTEADFSEIEGALSGDPVIYFYAESKPDSAGYYWHEKNGEPVVWSSGDEKLRFTLTDEGSGYRVAAYPADCLGDLVIPDEYNGLPVVEIAPLGFIGHDDLTGISFPDTLQKIGRAAFAGCDNLTEIVIPEGVTELGALSISYCRRIEYIYIPGTVNHIPGYLICSDGNLKSVEMGDGIRSIGQYSIYECRKLEKIRFSDSIQELRSPLRNCPMLADVCLPESLVLLSWPEDSGTFMRYLRIPDQVTDISLMGGDTSGWSRTFVVPESLVKSQHRFTNGDRIYFKGSEEAWNQSIRTQTNDDMYTSIYEKKQIWFYSENQPESPGFYWYEENGLPKEWRYDEDSLVFTLTEDGSGYSVSTIPGQPLERLVIPGTYNGLPVTEIADKAFMYREDLRSVIIPGTVRKIGFMAFYACEALTEVILPDTLEEMGESAFSWCTSLTAVELPGRLLKVPRDAFAYDRALSEVVFGDGIREIGGRSFRACHALREAVLPDSVEYLDESPFMDCPALASLRLSEGLERYYLPPDAAYSYLELPASVHTVILYMGRNIPLNEIVLPASLETVSGYAYDYDRYFYYMGTEEAWSTINLDAFTGGLDEWVHVLFYAEEEPDTPGSYWHYAEGRAVPW